MQSPSIPHLVTAALCKAYMGTVQLSAGKTLAAFLVMQTLLMPFAREPTSSASWPAYISGLAWHSKASDDAAQSQLCIVFM